MLFLLVCAAAGFGITGLTRLPIRFEERVAVAGPLGALAVGLGGWGWSVAIGFDRTSLGLAVVTATLVSLPGWTRIAPGLGDEARGAWRRVRLPWRDGESLRPLVLLLVVAWPVTIRIFALAWMASGQGGLDVGHLATYADGSAHLAYAGRFVSGGEVPIASPIAAGEPARYHLLADLFAAQASLLGVSLTSALAVTSGFLALFFPAIAYCCGVRLVANRWAALVGVVVFCAGGTLGFVHLFGDIGDHGWGILWQLPRDYSRDPASLLWMDNPSLSYLHAQRNGLFGLPLGLVAVTLLRCGVEERRAAAFTAAGVLVGAVPLANGFAFVVPMAIASAWAVMDRHRPWWRFFLPALVLGLPAAWWLQPAESSVRWFPGWMADDGVGGWLVFWARNAGPFLVLLVVACAWRGTVPRRTVRAFLPLWLLWIVPNLVAFHPWEWNNTKYFAYWQLIGSFLVGAVLVRLVREGIAGRVAAGVVVAVVVVVALTASGVADLSRAMDRSATRIPWASADALEVAAWLRDSTDPGVVVAAAPAIDEPVVALSGRRFVSGFPGWTFDLGVPDWAARSDDEQAILRGGADGLAAARRRGVDLVVIGPIERGPSFQADEAWWAANASLVHRFGDWSVYAVPR